MRTTNGYKTYVGGRIAVQEPLGAGGLWRYVSLGRPTGDETRLDGLFIFQNGRFVQQSLNLGEPATSQVVQAHAGTYTVVATFTSNDANYASGTAQTTFSIT